MAFAIAFRPATMDGAQYDECIRRLEAAGAEAPAGRLYHACHGSGGQLRVFDVWESMEAFERFGSTLSPSFRRSASIPGLRRSRWCITF
jgi:cyclopropane fatty-acyl-phospholipid synthase-like methyltransferase